MKRMTLREHTFEHLGKPPYKFVGVGDLVFTIPGTGINKAGGSCDHCGTAIRTAYFFTSADGKTFKVGSSCVEKSGDKGLRKFVTEEARKLKRQKQAAKLPQLVQEILTLTDELKAITESHKHPFIPTKTYHDYLVYLTVDKTPTQIQNSMGYAKLSRIVGFLNKLKGEM